MFLFLSSDTCTNIHPSNNPWEFTIDLPKLLNVSGDWGCALTEIQYDGGNSEDLYVFCDICEFSCVNGALLPLLRVVNSPALFHTPYFIPISRDQVSQLCIYIRNKHLETPSFPVRTLRCTLQLQQR